MEDTESVRLNPFFHKAHSFLVHKIAPADSSTQRLNPFFHKAHSFLYIHQSQEHTLKTASQSFFP